MDKQEQNNNWSRLSEESKNEIKELYRYAKEAVKESCFGNTVPTDLMEKRYGFHNLNELHKIRIWADVEKLKDNQVEHNDMSMLIKQCGSIYYEHIPDKVVRKAVATLKIYKLIELGYGGNITEKEWMSDYENIYSVFSDAEGVVREIDGCGFKHFVSFHTPEQREEFMSYPENRELVKEYYIC